MNEFTKGPWKLFGHGVIQSECNGIVVCEIEEDKYGPKTDAERRANAHLIAAAPDMYEFIAFKCKLCDGGECGACEACPTGDVLRKAKPT